MPAQSNPTLPDIEWEGYKLYDEVQYDPNSWNSRHWVCPVCLGVTTVQRQTCDFCLRSREKKVVGHNRLGNPVEKWVMLTRGVSPNAQV